MPDSQRIDRWLWFARFFKSRTLAAKACDGRRVRVNRQVIAKSSATLKVGDVLTFPQARRIRVIKVLDLGQRRGPAAEAQTLYEDLDPPAPRPAEADAPEPAGAPPARAPGSGRPTKRDRRALDALKKPGD